MPYVPFHFFVILFFAVTFGAQIVLYRFVSRYLVSRRAGRKLTRLWLPLAFVIINLPLLFIRIDGEMFYGGFARTYIMMPFFAYETLSLAVFLAAGLAYGVKVVFRLLKRIWSNGRTEKAPPVPSESRRSFIRTGAIGLGAYTFLGSLRSIYDRDEYKVDRVTLPVKNLPHQLDGLTISMISDIHSGMYMLERDMETYVEAINHLNADMVFIPGDFVTSKDSEMLPLVKAFSGLKSKYGTYTCLGNHDFFANPAYVTKKLRDIGMKVLRNETEELDLNGAKLMLSGVDDGRHANFPKVSYEASSLNTARILLCHKPYYFENAVAGNYDLMLSGHTHGGQIVLLDLFGVKVTPATIVSPYVSGKYKLSDALMYVSRGVGTIGLPIRVNCPPEITLFTLRTKKSH
ncbi:MAG: metallophosphoesterase [Bacteroidetes bacterium]|nr:metallophosphoesterase [Bacteroidota bacterium]